MFWKNAEAKSKPNIPERVLLLIFVLLIAGYLYFIISSNSSIGYKEKVQREQFLDYGDKIPSLSLKDKEAIFKIVEDALAGYNKIDYGSAVLDSASNVVIVSLTLEGQSLGRKIFRGMSIAMSVKSAVFDISNEIGLIGIDYRAMDIYVDILGDFNYHRNKDLAVMERAFERGVTGVWVSDDKGAYDAILPARTADPGKRLADHLQAACKIINLAPDEWQSNKVKVYFFKSLALSKKAYSNVIE